FAEFIAYAKANPGKLNFASAGVGTAPHLAGEMIKLAAGIEMTHVPYRGIGAAYPDVMSGKVQLAFSSIAGAVPFTADSRVRPIATTGSARSPVYPDVPTVAESGLPGFDVDLWIGIYAPARLPPAVLTKLNGKINSVLRPPRLKRAFPKIGTPPRGTTPEQAAAFTRSEYEKWKKVIVDGKINPEYPPAVHPIPDADVGSISHIRRTSPGAALGYLSFPRYFFASESMCAAAPSSVTRRTRPRIWT